MTRTRHQNESIDREVRYEFHPTHYCKHAETNKLRFGQCVAMPTLSTGIGQSIAQPIQALTVEKIQLSQQPTLNTAEALFILDAHLC